MSEQRMTDQELAAEAQRWDSRVADPKDWVDAPDAIPRANGAGTLSVRMPNQLLMILKEFAKRANVSLDVLVKQWLDDRIQRVRQQTKDLIANGATHP